jgi:hypothetical protein
VELPHSARFSTHCASWISGQDEAGSLFIHSLPPIPQIHFAEVTLIPIHLTMYRNHWKSNGAIKMCEDILDINGRTKTNKLENFSTVGNDYCTLLCFYPTPALEPHSCRVLLGLLSYIYETMHLTRQVLTYC